MRYLKMIWFVVLFAVGGSAFSEEDIIEKAWKCSPSLVHGNTRVPLESEPSSIFKFDKCNDATEEDKNLMSKALLEKYGRRELDSWIMFKFSLEKPNREKAAEAEILKARKGEKLVRQQQLKSGEIKPASMKDVWLANDQISSLQEIMAAALLKADNSVYGGKVIIEGEERDGVLRARFDSDVLAEMAYQTPMQEETGVELGPELALRARALSQNGTRHYGQFNLSKKTINFIQNLRVGSSVWVVGRYKANRKYKLTNRTERTMPVLDVLYLGE